MILPLGWFVHYIHAKHVLKHLIYFLCFPIDLRMVGGAKVHLCTQICKNTLPKIGSKLGILVRNYCLMKSMQSENFLHENICNGIGFICGLTSIKCDGFVNLSTTTMMESSCLIVIGNHVIKSMEMTSHFHFGIGKGCNKPVGC